MKKEEIKLELIISGKKDRDNYEISTSYKILERQKSYSTDFLRELKKLTSISDIRHIAGYDSANIIQRKSKIWKIKAKYGIGRHLKGPDPIRTEEVVVSVKSRKKPTKEDILDAIRTSMDVILDLDEDEFITGVEKFSIINV